MQTNETLKDEQLTGLINDNQKQDIEKDIDSIKQLALEKKYEDIKTLIAGLGKYKNLIDIEREIRGIKTQWDYHGISDEFYETLETFRSKISNIIFRFFKQLQHLITRPQFKSTFINNDIFSSFHCQYS